MSGVKIWLIGTSRYLFLFLFVFVAPLSAQLENGLVAYFPLDGNGSDLVSGANGTIYGATPAENRWGDSGKAYSFDGTDDYIEVPFQSTYSTDAFSFSLWVKPTATSSQHTSPLTFRASTRGHILYKTPQNNWGAWVGTGGSWAENVLGQIEVGNWQFIASTYASGSYKGYLDGDLVSTISPSFSKNTSSPLRIGAGKTEGSPDFFFVGVVDEVRLYNRALSAAEVQQLQLVDHQEVPPSNLRTVGGLAITENSSAGTVVGEFNATDPNGDTVTYALMPALPSEFSPVLWLDANDSSTVIESGGAVSAWQDKSGNDYHFTQNVDNSKRPLYSTTSLNGMPAITFDGSNDYLSISSRLGFSANPDISVFAVTSFLSLADNDERIFQIGSNSHGLAVTGGTGSWCWRFNGGHERYNDVTINNVAQQAWVRQAGTNYQASRFFYNGLEQARVAGSSDASSPTNVAEIASIGKSTTGSNFANVKISELIVLNDSSEASRRGVETYLARKWGLTYTQPTSDGIFEIESNGTLKSLVALDRETVATLPITVRATDPNGNFIKEDFSVTVVDDGLEDTDSDGFLDSVEYQEGSDPISNASIPGLEYGLTAWYPFDGNASDMSGNNRHATAVNSHSYISAKVGSGVRIVGSSSGVTGHVSLPYITSLENSDYTFAFWVLEESMLYAHGEDYLFYGQIERVSNRDDGVAFPFSSTTDYISGINRSSWNHYAVTKSGSTNRGYLNGSLVATGSWTSPSAVSGTATHSALGRHWWSGGASSTRLVAVFDDLRIYDRSISGTEASLLYQLPASDVDGDGYTYAEELEAGTNPNSSLSKPSLMDGLLLWYPLDGNTSDMS
ncbi:LamG-like jellyroll fold domain-containing protein, partial [Candidatus Chordibacter forsetii]|uniref:LamG-like jellyroll fold domain-containing protein n=1 Tax=Candidatus Chordibacter forsetii TaxID=3381758 RepID=UPI003899DE94